MAEQQIKFKNLYSPRSIDTGGAERMQALQRLAGQVGDVAFEIGKQKRIEEGELAGVEAAAKAVETGEYEKPSSFTFFGQAAQDSFQRTYAAKINNQMTQELTAAYEESKGQASPLEYFDTVSNAYLKGMNQSVSADLKPLMDSTYASVQGSFKTQLIGDAIKREQADASAANAQLYRDTLVQSQIAAQAGNAEGMLQAQLNFQEILKTDATLDVKQKQDLLNNFYYETQLNESLGGLRKMYREKGIGASIDLIESIEKATLKLEPGEQEKIIDAMRNDLSDLIQLDDLEQERIDKDTEDRQEKNFNDLFISLLDGNTTFSEIRTAAQLNDIDGDQAETLFGVIQRDGSGYNDQTIRTEIEKAIINDPEKAMLMIRANAGKMITDDTGRRLMVSAIKAAQKESELSTDEAKRFRSNFNTYIKTPNDFGVLEFKNPTFGVNLQLIWDERVLAGESPQLVTLELMSVYDQENTPGVVQGVNLAEYQDFNNYNDAIAKLNENQTQKSLNAAPGEKDSVIDETNELKKAIDDLFHRKKLKAQFKEDLDEYKKMILPNKNVEEDG